MLFRTWIWGREREIFNSKVCQEIPGLVDKWLRVQDYNNLYKITNIPNQANNKSSFFSSGIALILALVIMWTSQKHGRWQKVARKLVRVSPLKRQADTFINLGLTEIDGISPVIRGLVLAVPIPGVTASVVLRELGTLVKLMWASHANSVPALAIYCF